jgi:hypothetical protein
LKTIKLRLWVLDMHHIIDTLAIKLTTKDVDARVSWAKNRVVEIAAYNFMVKPSTTNKVLYPVLFALDPKVIKWESHTFFLDPKVF